jgi:hypothetical protein
MGIRSGAYLIHQLPVLIADGVGEWPTTTGAIGRGNKTRPPER